MTGTIQHREIAPGVHHLEIDRPEVRNALGVREYQWLADHLETLQAGAARAIVISGRGASFCAGNELAEFRTAWPQPAHGPVFRFLSALHACEFPVLAAVHGGAVGVGATMLLHCDVVLAQRGAFLKYPFVNLGISVEGGSSILLPARVGYLRAMDLLLSGRSVPAEEAAALGLVSELVDDDVLTHALTRAEAIAKQSPAAVRMVKRQLRASLERNAFPTLFEVEIQAINELLTQRNASGE